MKNTSESQQPQEPKRATPSRLSALAAMTPGVVWGKYYGYRNLFMWTVLLAFATVIYSFLTFYCGLGPILEVHWSITRWLCPDCDRIRMISNNSRWGENLIIALLGSRWRGLQYMFCKTACQILP